jgi:8-oxo-dGTP pyrophosphatase MutT (NUDIX family)
VDPDEAQVRAAGGVVWRHEGDQMLVAIVHRPRYGDWSLPKGKLDPGESWEEAALREVEEEVGLVCELDQELPTVFYTDHKGRSKAVRWWAMEIVEDNGFEPDEEVDELRWVSLADAAQMLTYPTDRSTLEAAL